MKLFSCWFVFTFDFNFNAWLFWMDESWMNFFFLQPNGTICEIIVPDCVWSGNKINTWFNGTTVIISFPNQFQNRSLNTNHHVQFSYQIDLLKTFFPKIFPQFLIYHFVSKIIVKLKKNYQKCFISEISRLQSNEKLGFFFKTEEKMLDETL